MSHRTSHTCSTKASSYAHLYAGHTCHIRSGLYYDFQLSKAREKFGHKVLTFKLPCCKGQLALFPREIAWIALLYDVTWSIHAVSLGNGALCPWQHGNLNVKLRDQTYSTENGSTCEIVYIYICKVDSLPDSFLSCLKGLFFYLVEINSYSLESFSLFYEAY